MKKLLLILIITLNSGLILAKENTASSITDPYAWADRQTGFASANSRIKDVIGEYKDKSTPLKTKQKCLNTINVMLNGHNPSEADLGYTLMHLFNWDEKAVNARNFGEKLDLINDNLNQISQPKSLLLLASTAAAALIVGTLAKLALAALSKR